MRDESEIFKEWFEKNFPGEEFPPDPLEYVYLRETINFQCYLAQEQIRDMTKESAWYKAMIWANNKLDWIIKEITGGRKNVKKRGKQRNT